VTSRDHPVDVQGDPLPLVTSDQGCLYRNHAIHTLEAAGRSWHIAFSSPNLTGLQAAVSGELRQVLGPERPGVGRGLEQRGLDEIRHALEHRLVAGQGLGIAGGELRDLLPGQLFVGSHEQEATVGKRRERRGAARQQLKPVAGQLEVADDLRPEQAVHVGGGGHLEARPQLFRHARAPHHVAALEHQHPLPGAGEIGGGDEAIVAGPDDDDVVRPGHDDPFAGSRALQYVTGWEATRAPR